MSKISYFEKHGMAVVPKYEDTRPIGFDIVKVSTGEVMGHRKMLIEAEEFIEHNSPKESESREDILSSAAEVEGF